jgi:hypothetical protein
MARFPRTGVWVLAALFSAACQQEHDDAGADHRSEDGGPPIDAAVPPVPGFLACGVPVAVADPPVLEGFTLAPVPGVLTRDVVWSGDHAIVLDDVGLEVRDRAFVPVARLALLGGTRLGVTGSLALVGAGSVTVVDLSDLGAPRPVAQWEPPVNLRGYASGAWLIGTSGRFVLLGTPAGVSVVDVRDPHVPREVRCLVPPLVGDDVELGPFVADGDLVVVAARRPGESVAAIYDLAQPAGESPAPTVRVMHEGTIGVHGRRVIVWEDLHRVVLYEVGADGRPVEIARVGREGDTRYAARGGDLLILGGFALYGGDDPPAGGLALDLTAHDALPLYRVTSADDGAEAARLSWEAHCRLTLTGIDTDASWNLLPLSHPDERFITGATPSLPCPPPTVPEYQIREAARAPDGRSVLLEEDEGGWSALEPTSGEWTPVAARDVGGTPFWMDGAFVFASSGAGDSDWTTRSVLLRLTTPGGQQERFERPGPLVSVSGGARHVWALSEPRPGRPGQAPAPLEGLRLWRLGTTGGPEDLELPANAQPSRVFAVDDGAWVLDAAGSLYQFNASGRVAATRHLPVNLDATRATASSLGLFIFDRSDRLQWVRADGEITTLEGFDGLTPGAADRDHVYLTKVGLPETGYAESARIVVLRPGPTPSVVGRIPAAGTVLPGEPLLVVGPRLLMFTPTP